MTPLYEVFPDLYNSVGSKGAMAAELWVGEGNSGAWNPRFARPFYDWELGSTQEFISLLNRFLSPLSWRIRWFGRGDSSGGLNLKSYFKFLEGGLPISAPSNMFWNPLVPSKIGFFAWEDWWGQVLPTTQLKKSGFIWQASLLWDELSYIVIHCPSIWGQWTDLSAFGAIWVSPLLVKDLISNWTLFPVRKKVKKLWRQLL